MNTIWYQWPIHGATSISDGGFFINCQQLSYLKSKYEHLYSIDQQHSVLSKTAKARASDQKRRTRDLPFSRLYKNIKIDFSRLYENVKSVKKIWSFFNVDYRTLPTFHSISLWLLSSYWALNMNPKNKLPLFPFVVKKFLQSLCRWNWETEREREKLES